MKHPKSFMNIPKLRFEPTLSFGSILLCIGWIMSAGIFYGSNNMRMSRMEEKQADCVKRLDSDEIMIHELKENGSAVVAVLDYLKNRPPPPGNFRFGKQEKEP
jgi:hypothetical protein